MSSEAAVVRYKGNNNTKNTRIIRVLFTVVSWLHVPLVQQVTGPVATTVNNTGIIEYFIILTRD